MKEIDSIAKAFQRYFSWYINIEWELRDFECDGVFCRNFDSLMNIITASEVGAVIFDSSDKLIDSPVNFLFGLIVVPNKSANHCDYNEGYDRNTGLHLILSIRCKLEGETF